MFHGIKSEELAEQEQKNRAVIQQIDRSKKNVSDHESVKQKLTVLRAREEAIAKLQSARSGPTAVLLEFARILTPNRGPSVSPERLNQLSRDNPLAAMNAGWDPRRLWIVREKSRASGLRADG